MGDNQKNRECLFTFHCKIFTSNFGAKIQKFRISKKIFLNEKRTKSEKKIVKPFNFKSQKFEITEK